MQERFQMFTVLITKINRSIRRIKTEEMAEFDLKSPHVSCLYYLYKNACLTAKALCDICGEDKASVSRSLEFLEEKGFVVCGTSAKKRYKSPLTLTEKGKEVGGRLAKKIDAVLEKAGAGLSEEDRAIFYRCLGIICENLQQICDNYDD